MKPLIYTVNTSSQAVTSGGTVDLGSVARKQGCDIKLVNNSITTSSMGCYDVLASVTGTATTAGNITLTLYKNGTAVAGATETTTVSTVGDYFSLDVDAIIRNMCYEPGSSLTLVLSGTGAATVTNVSMVVSKL